MNAHPNFKYISSVTDSKNSQVRSKHRRQRASTLTL